MIDIKGFFRKCLRYILTIITLLSGTGFSMVYAHFSGLEIQPVHTFIFGTIFIGIGYWLCWDMHFWRIEEIYKSPNKPEQEQEQEEDYDWYDWDDEEYEDDDWEWNEYEEEDDDGCDQKDEYEDQDESGPEYDKRVEEGLIMLMGNFNFDISNIKRTTKIDDVAPDEIRRRKMLIYVQNKYHVRIPFKKDLTFGDVLNTLV